MSGDAQVDISMDATSKKIHLRFQLCPHEDDPLITRYGLDLVRVGDTTRRGLTCIVSNKTAIASLKALDQPSSRTAVAHSRILFRRTLTGRGGTRTIQARPRTLEGTTRLCPTSSSSRSSARARRCRPRSSASPTGHGGARQLGDVLSGRGTRVVPVVSAYGLWFMAGGCFGLCLQAERMLVDPGRLV